MDEAAFNKINSDDNIFFGGGYFSILRKVFFFFSGTFARNEIVGQHLFSVGMIFEFNSI